MVKLTKAQRNILANIQRLGDAHVPIMLDPPTTILWDNGLVSARVGKLGKSTVLSITEAGRAALVPATDNHNQDEEG